MTRYAYDDVGNLISVTNAQGQPTQFAYDQQDNLLSTTDAHQPHDALRVRRAQPPSSSAPCRSACPSCYTYDQVGNLATRTDFRGKQTGYDYDPMDRLIAKRPDPTLGEPMVTFSYTADGSAPLDDGRLRHDQLHLRPPRPAADEADAAGDAHLRLQPRGGPRLDALVERGRRLGRLHLRRREPARECHRQPARRRRHRLHLRRRRQRQERGARRTGCAPTTPTTRSTV